jgi:molybdopterin converting factor small subunit
MDKVTIEVWMWLRKELGGDFESLSEMRSKKEEVKEGTTIRELLDRLASRYPPVAEKIFDLKERTLYQCVVLNYNDRVISPHLTYEQVLKNSDKVTLLPMYMGG